MRIRVEKVAQESIRGLIVDNHELTRQRTHIAYANSATNGVRARIRRRRHKVVKREVIAAVVLKKARIQIVVLIERDTLGATIKVVRVGHTRGHAGRIGDSIGIHARVRGRIAEQLLDQTRV